MRKVFNVVGLQPNSCIIFSSKKIILSLIIRKTKFATEYCWLPDHRKSLTGMERRRRKAASPLRLNGTQDLQQDSIKAREDSNLRANAGGTRANQPDRGQSAGVLSWGNLHSLPRSILTLVNKESQESFGIAWKLPLGTAATAMASPSATQAALRGSSII